MPGWTSPRCQAEPPLRRTAAWRLPATRKSTMECAEWWGMRPGDDRERAAARKSARGVGTLRQSILLWWGEGSGMCSGLAIHRATT